MSQSAAVSRTSRGAVLVLAFCCLWWGASFPIMQIVMRALTGHLTNATGQKEPSVSLTLAAGASFSGWRSLLAAGLYGLATLRRQRNMVSRDVKSGAVIGAFIGLGAALQMAGLRYTLPSVSGFLTALVVVFTPLAQAFFFRKHVRPRMWLAVLVASAGTVVLSQAGSGAQAGFTAAPPFPYFGESLTILGSLFFTGQILALDQAGPECDGTRMTFAMLVTMGALNLLLGLLLGGSVFYGQPLLSTLCADPNIVVPLFVLALLCSGLALHLMNTYQPLISPVVACVTYCLEPVFATIFSIMWGNEGLSAATVLGGGVVLAGVLLAAKAQT